MWDGDLATAAIATIEKCCDCQWLASSSASPLFQGLLSVLSKDEGATCGRAVVEALLQNRPLVEVAAMATLCKALDSRLLEACWCHCSAAGGPDAARQ